jgi:hypothetical protein
MGGVVEAERVGRRAVAWGLAIGAATAAAATAADPSDVGPATAAAVVAGMAVVGALVAAGPALMAGLALGAVAGRGRRRPFVAAVVGLAAAVGVVVTAGGLALVALGSTVTATGEPLVAEDEAVGADRVVWAAVVTADVLLVAAAASVVRAGPRNVSEILDMSEISDA